MKTDNQHNRITRQSFLRSIALGTPLLAAVTALGQTDMANTEPDSMPDAGNLRTFVELARTDIRRQRALIFAQNLPLTDEEAMEFWPVERRYETALSGWLDERYNSIVQFLQGYDTMSNEQATELAKKVFALEEKRIALKKKFFGEFCKVIPATKAARFFQIDNQLNMIQDLRVASFLPLIK